MIAARPHQPQSQRELPTPAPASSAPAQPFPWRRGLGLEGNHPARRNHTPPRLSVPSASRLASSRPGRRPPTHYLSGTHGFHDVPTRGPIQSCHGTHGFQRGLARRAPAPVPRGDDSCLDAPVSPAAPPTTSADLTPFPGDPQPAGDSAAPGRALGISHHLSSPTQWQHDQDERHREASTSRLSNGPASRALCVPNGREPTANLSVMGQAIRRGQAPRTERGERLQSAGTKVARTVVKERRDVPTPLSTFGLRPRRPGWTLLADGPPTPTRWCRWGRWAVTAPTLTTAPTRPIRCSRCPRWGRCPRWDGWDGWHACCMCHDGGHGDPEHTRPGANARRPQPEGRGRKEHHRGAGLIPA